MTGEQRERETKAKIEKNKRNQTHRKTEAKRQKDSDR